MNRTILGMAIKNVFLDAADDKGGGGAGGGAGGGTAGETKVDAAAARTFVADYVSDPESVKTMPDDKVVEYHGKLKTKLDGLVKTEVERVKGAPAAEATALKAKWEKGEIKIEAPKDSKLSKEDVDEIAAIARERGLSQEQAVELLTQRSVSVDRAEAKAIATFNAAREKWIEEVKSDPVIGGAKLSETERICMRPIEIYMSPKLREELKRTGFGYYPDFVKFLHNVGSVMAEDKPGDAGGGTGGGGDKKDAATVLYGGTK